MSATTKYFLENIQKNIQCRLLNNYKIIIYIRLSLELKAVSNELREAYRKITKFYSDRSK